MNQWPSDFMIPSHLFTYFWGDLLSQTGVCLNNGRGRKKKELRETSLLVLQYEGISLPLEHRNHREALTVAEASVSQSPLSIRDFRVPLDVVYVDDDVLLCESELPK